jgi:dipeptidyl aminopeptidase/acylaminoacyl peptidase
LLGLGLEETVGFMARESGRPIIRAAAALNQHGGQQMSHRDALKRLAELNEVGGARASSPRPSPPTSPPPSRAGRKRCSGGSRRGGPSSPIRSSEGYTIEKITKRENKHPIDAMLDVAVAGEQLVLEIDSPARPREIGLLDLATGFRYLTDTRPPAIQTTTPVEPDMVRYPAADERYVHALLYRPHTRGPHPVLLSIHGGPEAQERPQYAYSGLYHYLLAQGIGVFAPNIAGSTGYGLAHRLLIYRDWGGIDLNDLDQAVRHLQALPDLDADRIAVFGASYGGFAALSCLARLRHPWVAGVSLCGPTNLLTLAQACRPTWKSTVANVLGDPETDAAHLLQRSPITYADAIDAPLFVLQGARDPRVPQAESDRLVTRLSGRSVDVRYDVYPDEGHGFANRDNQIKAYGDMAEFIVSHLLDK